uniref:Secreted protein n=1 Tax=Strongyloides papillosus TaxID=174720 RepID=A0A0N5BB49_STREA
MFLKIFTASIIILLSRNLTSEASTISENKGLNVIVDGTLSWEYPSVSNVNGKLQKSGLTVTSADYTQTPSEIYLSTYIDSKDLLDKLSVTFNYKFNGQDKRLVKKIPDECNKSESEVEKGSSGTVNLEDKDYNCNLGNIRLDGHEEE